MCVVAQLVCAVFGASEFLCGAMGFDIAQVLQHGSLAELVGLATEDQSVARTVETPMKKKRGMSDSTPEKCRDQHKTLKHEVSRDQHAADVITPVQQMPAITPAQQLSAITPLQSVDMCDCSIPARRLLFQHCQLSYTSK